MASRAGTGGFVLPSQQSQPYGSPLPSGGQVSPGSITYTTSTNPDGTIIYHPFRAVEASYETPQGIIHGIQWVPAEATRILPTGAQPATAEFTASWKRGLLTREDEKALNKWQREEEKRRRKEEKKEREKIEEAELRIARERDVMARQRRNSFNRSPAPPSQIYPPASGYSPHQDPHGASDLDRRFTNMSLDRREGERAEYARERQMSGNYGTQARNYSVNETDRARKASGSFSSPAPGAYSSPGGGYYPPAASYASPNPYNRSSSPFGQPGILQSSPNMRPADYPPQGPGYPPSYAPTAQVTEPIPRGSSPYGRPASPYARPTSPYTRPAGDYARPPSPYARPAGDYARPPSPYARPASPYARSASPYANPPSPYIGPPQANVPGTYPRGHILEGQPMPRSRAPSPVPPPGVYMSGPGISQLGGAPALSRASPSVGGGAIIQPPSDPQQQLSAPEGFSRPPNAAQPYTAFNLMKVQDMDEFFEHLPRMPLVLDTHDVYHEDWIRFMNDVALAWAGKMPIPEFASGRSPKVSTLVADLIDLWNASFFRMRRVEVVLYKGRERRSGSNAGTIDHQLPTYESNSLSESSDSDSASNSDDDRYPIYGRTDALELAEAKRRRRERIEEKKWLKKEKKIRKKAKERERRYSLYLTYLPPSQAPALPGVSY